MVFFMLVKCVTLHKAFATRCHLSIPCFISFKVSLQRTTKKFLRFKHPIIKKFLRFYHATQRRSCPFIMQPQRSSCSFQDSSSIVADTKRSSCVCIIFGLYCRPFLAVGLCVLHKCIIENFVLRGSGNGNFVL